MESAGGLACAPSCLTCHTKEAGGPATANTKLGITLRRNFSLGCCDDDELVSVVEQLAAAAVDSDGDGAPDLAELQMGTDPNDPTAGAPLACFTESKSSGCGVAPQRTHGELMWLPTALALWLVARRARSGTRQRRV